MVDLSAGTVSLPVKPDTSEFGKLLGAGVLSSVDSVGKLAKKAFSDTFGEGLKATLLAQKKDVLSASAGVERASMAIRVAQDAEVKSAAALRVAEAQVSEARLKYAADSSKAIAAEEKFAAAQRVHAASSGKVESATAALIPAQDALALSQGKLEKTTTASHTALGKLGGAAHSVGSAIAGLGLPLAAAGAGMVILGAESVKAYGNFESATTRLVTDAGESAKNLGAVQTGLLKISTATGTSASEIAKGMYLVESAGYHGATGLKVMQAASEGAKIGGADLKTVSDALTTTMTDFGKAAGPPATVMSKLIATVSTGKTTMEDLAGSLHSVLPAAAAAHMGLAEILSAVGTMTAEGISADQATQNLNHSILSLQAPSHVASAAMAGIGISSLDVAKNLGKRGLAGTYDVLLGAMAKHSHAGMIVVKSFADSAQASASMTKALSLMPPQMRATADAFEHGHVTSKAWAASLKQYPATAANLGKQFATLVKHSTGFSDALKSGEGPTRTAAAQLEKMLGGTTGLQVALHLTGEHMSTFVANTKSIGKATMDAHGHVRDWAVTQKTFNFMMDKAKVSLENAGVTIGKALMPAIKALLPFIPQIATDIAKLAPAIKWVAVQFVGFIANLLDGAREWMVFFRNLNDGWKQITGAFKNVVAAFADGWKQIAGFLAGAVHNFQDGWKQISGFLTGVVHNFQDGGKQIGSFFHGVQGWLSDLVKAFADGWHQIVTGVTSTWSNIVKAFSDGWHQISSFFAGAGTWLLDAGRNVIAGLVKGITGAIGSVTSAVSGVANSVIGTFKGLLGIHSPSKVFHDFAVNINQGLIQGLLGSKSQVVAATNTIANTITNMFATSSKAAAAHFKSDTKALASVTAQRSKVIDRIAADHARLNIAHTRAGRLSASTALARDTKTLEALAARRSVLTKQIAADRRQMNATTSSKTEKAALALLTKDTAKLVTLTTRRAALASQITAQQTIISNAQSARANDITSTRDATTGLFSVTNYTSGKSMVAGLQQIIAATKQFKDLLARLVKAGIDPATYRQLVTAGVGGGGIVAAQLLLQQPDTIKQVAALQGDLAKEAGSLATTSADHLYDTGIASAQGLLKGLQSQSTDLTNQMAQLSDQMLGSMAKSLGIKAGVSFTFHSQGKSIAKGIASGISSSSGEITAALQTVTSAPVKSASAPKTTKGVTAAATGPVVYMPDTITVRDAKGFEAKMTVIAEHTYQVQTARTKVAVKGGKR